MKAVLDKRLSAVSGYVSGKTLLDVGTDHAKLPVWLLLENKIEKALATDINEGPLKFAKELIKETNFEEKISAFINDGIKGIDLSEVSDISICGMGGELIAEILEKGKDEHYYNINFILNPMTRDDELRRYLSLNGFVIRDETAVCQNGKVYSVMKASFEDGKREISSLEALIGPFRGESEEEKAYIDKVINRYKKQLCDNEKREKSEKIIRELEGIKNDRW